MVFFLVTDSVTDTENRYQHCNISTSFNTRFDSFLFQLQYSCFLCYYTINMDHAKKRINQRSRKDPKRTLLWPEELSYRYTSVSSAEHAQLGHSLCLNDMKCVTC